MKKHQDPLTESECAILSSSTMTIIELAQRFNCGATTIRRARKEVRTGAPFVYLFKRYLDRPPRQNHRLDYDATQVDLGECALGRNPIAACDAHLEDLRRVHGSR